MEGMVSSLYQISNRWNRWVAMAAKLRVCSDCWRLTDRKRCSIHDTTRQRGHEAAANYGRRWRRERFNFLREHPWCADCVAEGNHYAADEVDHIIPHRGDPILFWDRANWAGRCTFHHRMKTATENRRA